MSKKYWEMTRKQDIESAKNCLLKAKMQKNSMYNRLDLQRVARIYIDSVRNCNEKLKKYQ